MQHLQAASRIDPLKPSFPQKELFCQREKEEKAAK
jgi:hypothetical protein